MRYKIPGEVLLLTNRLLLLDFVVRCAVPGAGGSEGNNENNHSSPRSLHLSSFFVIEEETRPYEQYLARKTKLRTSFFLVGSVVLGANSGASRAQQRNYTRLRSTAGRLCTQE